MSASKPVTTRYALIAILVLLGSGVALGFVKGLGALKQEAQAVNQLVLDSKASENNVTRMKNLKERLSSLQDLELLANKMTSPQDSFQYQERSIQTLNHYAQQSGISISQINFSAKVVGVGNQGGNNVLITVSLRNPVGYTNFLKFMRLVESGLSQMQILQVQISKDKDEKVAVGPISIAIYVK